MTHVRPFRLADPAFAALASGRPTSDTLAELRKAQLSRHLLQLGEILRRQTPDWYATQPSRQTLSDPMVGLYAATAVTAIRSGTPPPDRPTLLVPGARVLTSTCDGRTLRVRLEDADPLRDRLGLTPAPRLNDAAVAAWQHRLDEAWRILVRRHPEAAATVAAVLRVIVPVRPDPSAVGLSATSANAFGAVAMSFPADGRALAVALVHESQHSLLNALRWLFDLVRPGSEPGYSPWRDDPRPPFGILHGAYAYLAVTRFWRTEATAPDRAGERDLAAFEFARWRAAVVSAADGLLAGNRLTAAGTRFVRAMRAEAAGWLADPVDPEVARLAEGANTDHRVRWRLRHLPVDPEVTASLVREWRAGRPAPPVPPPTVRPSAGRQLERSTRLDLAHAWLRQRGAPHADEPRPPADRDPAATPGGGVRPGDDAYLRGDHGSAHVAYLKELVEKTRVGGRPGPGPKPDRLLDDLWSGLALVSGSSALRARPEVVRALCHALGDADLAALTAWLDPPGD